MTRLPAGGIAATLPRDWRSAIAAAESSSFLRSFIAIKSQGWDKSNALVPAIDYDWYLDNV